MRGVYNIYEAARINRVPVVVLASTNHVTGLNEEVGVGSQPVALVRPDGIYGAGKVFGEALGRFYTDRKGVRVFGLRIANCHAKDEPHRNFEPGRRRGDTPSHRCRSAPDRYPPHRLARGCSGRSTSLQLRRCPAPIPSAHRLLAPDTAHAVLCRVDRDLGMAGGGRGDTHQFRSLALDHRAVVEIAKRRRDA